MLVGKNRDFVLLQNIQRGSGDPASFSFEGYGICLWGGGLEAKVRNCPITEVKIELYLFFLNSLNAELNPICHLLALLGAHHILHISRKRVKWTPTTSEFTITHWSRVVLVLVISFFAGESFQREGKERVTCTPILIAIGGTDKANSLPLSPHVQNRRACQLKQVVHRPEVIADYLQYERASLTL